MGLSSDDIARLGPSAKRQLLDKLGRDAHRSRPAKYGNEKAFRKMPNGQLFRFDSQKELRRYDELMVMQRAGEIKDLRLQVQFTLQESYTTSDGDKIRAMHYIADFVYKRKTKPDQNGQIYWLETVEDVKGVQTDVYKMKKKMMQDKFGIVIQEV